VNGIPTNHPQKVNQLWISKRLNGGEKSETGLQKTHEFVDQNFFLLSRYLANKGYTYTSLSHSPLHTRNTRTRTRECTRVRARDQG